jgi:hypothetical protein
VARFASRRTQSETTTVVRMTILPTRDDTNEALAWRMIVRV